jgi:hypothetical protein
MRPLALIECYHSAPPGGGPGTPIPDTRRTKKAISETAGLKPAVAAQKTAMILKLRGNLPEDEPS